MKCNHTDFGNNEKIGLPYIVRTHNNGLKPHSFCTRCGKVKNIGQDGAVRMGHYINVPVQIKKHLKVPGSNVSMHLVMQYHKKIEDFDYAYSMNKYNQEKIFTSIFKEYYQIPERTIQQFL